MGGKRQALRLLLGLIQAHRRSKVTQNLQARPATACKGAWSSWDRRHLIQCLQEDDTART
ncbi:MAG: hypothetical protein DUD39_03990 [Coriobacteriaceae bacterium]|nr:MAG: hypothetical protein DUD39_03990 [Coriobacteriaceae bacterium]